MLDLFEVVWTFLEGLTTGGWRTLVGTLLGGLGAVVVYRLAAGDPWRVWYAFIVVCLGIGGGMLSEPEGSKPEGY